MAAPLKSVDISSISKATPYIQRLIQDAKLRENVRTAYDSSRSAYARLTNGKPAAKVLLEDKKLQRDLQLAVYALREATTALTEAPKKVKERRRGGFARKVFILGLGFGLALASVYFSAWASGRPSSRPAGCARRRRFSSSRAGTCRSGGSATTSRSCRGARRR